MDKVDEIWLTMDNPEHIVTIDKALQRCAELLINNFISESNEEFLIRESFELEEDWRDQLNEVFKASRYCSTEGFDVGEAFDDTIFKVSEFNECTVMHILYPVLFYTLVLNNFDKQNTINRRAKRGSKSWGKTSDMFSVPAIDKRNSEEQISAKTKNRINKLKEELQSIYREKEAEYTDLLTKAQSEDELYQYYLVCEMENLLSHAKAAIGMLDCNKIGWIKTVAKRGLFARSILESQLRNGIPSDRKFKQSQSAGKPIDTILRLYVLEFVEHLIFNAECMSNGYRYSEIPKEFLLTSFLENQGIDKDEVFCSNNAENLTNQGKLVSLKPDIELGKDFAGLYGQLCLLQFDWLLVSDMLDNFLNKPRLEWFLQYEEHVEKYANAVLDGIQKMQAIDIRYFEVESLNIWEIINRSRGREFLAFDS